MNAFLVGVIISMVAYLAVGFWVGRKVKNVDDYYVAGRNAPVILIVGSLVASFLSTGAFLGDTGEAASGAFVAIVIVGIMQATGYLYGSNLFGRYIRRSKVLTIPEYFGKRFDSKRMRKLAGLTCIVAVTAYMLSATQGISSLMSNITGIDFKWCVIIAWCAYTFFTIYAGSPGVLITDTMMFLVFLLAAVIAIPFITMSAGGWFTAINNLASPDFAIPGIISSSGNAEYVASGGQTIGWAITYGVVWMLVVMVSPWQTSRYMMAKNEHTVMRSAIWASMAVITVTMFLYFGCVFVASVNPGIGADTMIWAAMNMMPLVIGVIMLTGILAAGISSATTFLSLVGFSLTNDILHVKEDDNGKHRLRVSRIGMFCVSLVVLALAYFNPPAIFWVMYFGGTVIAASWGPIALASIWSKRLTERGAFWGMLLGFLGCFVIRLGTALNLFTTPFFLDSFFVGIYLSIGGAIVGSLTSKVSAKEKAEREMLFVVPESEKDPVAMRKTENLWKVYIVFAVAMCALFVFGWAIPYMNAVG